MTNELIIIKQLPVIEERLITISNEIDNRVNNVLSMVCSDETVKEVKKLRANLNKEKSQFEDERKSIKTAIMAPYEDFDQKYKTYVKDKYDFADAELKRKIDDVENVLKEEKKSEVEAYFNEYLQSKNIDFVTFDQAGLNITLTASIKSLKEQGKAFIDRICDDLALIDTQEHKVEILVEYKQHMNVSQAITTVSERHKAIETENAKIEQVEAVKSEEEKVIEKVESVAAPVVEEKEYTLNFSVTATMDKLKALKQFLNDGGYIYE